MKLILRIILLCVVFLSILSQNLIANISKKDSVVITRDKKINWILSEQEYRLVSEGLQKEKVNTPLLNAYREVNKFNQSLILKYKKSNSIKDSILYYNNIYLYKLDKKYKNDSSFYVSKILVKTDSLIKVNKQNNDLLKKNKSIKNKLTFTTVLSIVLASIFVLR